MYLALKPGARCGWAAWSPGDLRPASGSFDMPAELGRAGVRMHTWLVELQQVHHFESLAYQSPAVPPGNATASLLIRLGWEMGLVAHIESYCEHLGKRCRHVSLGAWQRTFLGKGVGEKVKTFQGWMASRCDELGWWKPKRSREERDACGLLDHLILLEGRHTPPWRTRALTDLQAAQLATEGSAA